MAIRDQLINHFFQGICILLLLCSNLGSNFLIASDSEECEEHDGLYAIRHIGQSALAFDATDPNQVKVDTFNGAKAQLWKFKAANKLGLYFIVNEHNGKALHFSRRDDGSIPVTVSELNNTSLAQQWYHSVKGLLLNAANEKNIDIWDGRIFPGNSLFLWNDNGCPCQRFNLHLQENVS